MTRPSIQPDLIVGAIGLPVGGGHLASDVTLTWHWALAAPALLTNLSES